MNFTRFRLLTIAAFLITQIIVFSQKSSYSTTELKNDFSLFRKALEESHPSLYRYHSKKEIDDLFEKTLLSINQPAGELEFYKKLAAIISRIGCGHTGVALSDDYYKNHPVRTARFPFDIKFVGDRLFVIKNYNPENGLALGSELISLDKIPIPKLVNSFFPLMNGDGFITSSKYRRLEQYFARLVQVLYRESPSYAIEFKDAGGRLRTKSIKLVLVSSLPAAEAKSDLEFKTLGNSSIAVLTIRTFESEAKDGSGAPYPDFLAKCFKLLKEKKIQSLIIDLRGNGGGRDDYGSLLFAYLTNKPYDYYHYLEMNKPEYSFLKYTDREESFKAEMKNILIQRNDGKWVRKNTAHPCLPEQQPQPAHYDNRVFVLIDGNSFSATAEFSSIASYHKRALFVGEESGGALEGNTSGGGFDLTLPNTMLHVRIPLTKYVCAVVVTPDQVGRGIIPGNVVNPTLQGILSGRDEVMEQALSLAK